MRNTFRGITIVDAAAGVVAVLSWAVGPTRGQVPAYKAGAAHGNSEFTVEDSTTWTRPWTAVIPMRPLAGQMFEYACHEGNYGMTNLLAGARTLEAEAARKR